MSGGEKSTSVGVVSPHGASSPDLGSGTPFALRHAVIELGLHSPPLRARLRRLPVLLARRSEILRQSARGDRPLGDLMHPRQSLSPVSSWYWPLYEAAVRLEMRRLDGDAVVIQYGAAIRAVPGVPMATYEDMTVVQAGSHDQWWASRLSPDLAETWRRRQQAVYEAATVCCTTTSWVKTSIVDEYGVPPEKVHVVGVGRNTGGAPVLDRDWSRPRFLFVGRDWERKNGPLLLRAFERVRREIPEATLTLIGGVPEIGDLDGVRSLGLLSHGDARDAEIFRHAYETATTFVLPSLHEPSAVSYVEAMSTGLPVIGTTEGGSAELIGDAGVVIEPTSEDDLVAAMLQFCDPDKASGLALRAVERARGLTWPAVVQRILAALDGTRDPTSIP